MSDTMIAMELTHADNLTPDQLMVGDLIRIENDIVDDIINEAEAESERTCEVTGMPGTICQQGGWYKVLCYEESRKLKYKACSQDTEKYWEEKDNGKWND